MINIHRIESKTPYDFSEKMLRENLVLAEPETVDASHVLSSPGWTLYEFDYDKACSVFVDIGADGDLFSAPFAYSAQVRLARNYAEMPFELFTKLARSIKLSHRVTNLFNIGHCGSKLLHHVINASGEAWGLSEPKFTWDVAMHRKKLEQSMQLELLHAGLAFVSNFPRAKERSALVLKHFSQSTKIYDLWKKATPESLNLYMYRDAASWSNSMFGFAQRMGMPAPMPFSDRHFIWMLQSGAEPETFLDDVVEIESDTITFEELAACAWALHQQEFLKARENGMNFLTFRYNDLIQDREGLLKRVFTYCGFNALSIANGIKAFNHDAHKGEQSSHSKPVEKLGGAAKQRVAEILSNPRFWGAPHN